MIFCPKTRFFLKILQSKTVDRQILTSIYNNISWFKIVFAGLFHRAVLLSGSALASWALVEDPVSYAIRLARHVNCSVPTDLAREHERIVDCLRDTSLEALLAADVTPPAYLR